MADSAYYRPYLASDSELSDADSDTDTWTRNSTPRPENANPDFIDPRSPAVPNFAALARALQSPPADATGPSFVTIDQEDNYASNRLDPRTQYFPYSNIPVSNAPTSRPSAEAKDTATTSNVETVIMLRSRDRDKTIYAQPTACQLFLPRIYKNVVGFSIAQINMVSAFFYFSQIKENIAIQIYEQNAVLYEPLLYPSLTNTTPRLILNNIREGSYNITQLLTELQIQLNRVPLFYDFLNGFSDFLPLFNVNGDYSINFNYPGDYYYDAVRRVYIPNPTRAQIVSYYFQSQYANQFVYTNQQVRIAYYYPVVKEALLDPETDLDQYNFSGTGLSQTDTINYLIYSFQGLNDPIASTFINNNSALLDTYRLLHTFRYSLVNEYICNYNPTNNRVTIQCATLNNSLVNLLNAQYNSYLSQQLLKYGISAATYNTLAALNTNLLSIIQSMYDYLQTNFAVYFAINFGTYSRTYYGNLSNTVYITYGIDAEGIATQIDPNPETPPISNDILLNFRQNPPYLWPRMINLPTVEGAQRNMGSPLDGYPISSNYAYNLSQSNIDLNHTFIDLNGNIYTDPRRKAGDILVNVDASKYTIFQFRSKYRQTLQVETLPRQTNWRYPLWNQSQPKIAYPLCNLFDVSYCYVSPTTLNNLQNVTPFDISFNAIYGWSNISNTTTNFGYSFAQSQSLWGTNKEQINVTNSNGRYYRIQTPEPIVGTSNAYTYEFNITITPPQNSNAFASDLYAYFYHDIAAFGADAGNPRNELPIHYKNATFISSNSTSNTYSFTAYANQEYYLLVRPVIITPPSTDYLIIPWFTSPTLYSTLSYDTNFNPLQDPTTMLSNFNVAKVADPNFIRMPIYPSTLWNLEPNDASINTPVKILVFPIGYDTNEVSNDLTDYVPFAPFNTYSTINPLATVSVDPTNNFVFQYNSPYNNTEQSYFYSGSKNAILYSNAQKQYNPTTVAERQYKMVNYYATTYIHDTATPTYTSADVSPYVSSYTQLTTSNTRIPGYTYNSSNMLVLGAGVCGFMFIPGSGSWAIDRITFKTNFINPLASTNEQVHAVAIFITAEIYYQPISYMKLSNALAICLRTGESTYSSSNSLNIGFDASLGTYYTFSNYPQLVTRTNPISGFTQVPKVFVTDENAYYSVVAYTFTDYTNSNWGSNTISNLLSNYAANSNTFPENSVFNIQNLTGSPIAYPYANTAFPSTVFYDNQQPVSGLGVVQSTDQGNATPYGPPLGADESVVQYEQSLPYVNTHMHFLSPSYIVYDSNGFNSWTNIPITPYILHASISNYMLFQGTNFAIAKYVTYTDVTPLTPPARSFVYGEQITVQQIYPDRENTSLIAVSGNAQQYVFLGASNIPNSLVSQLRFKVYDPIQGVLSELPTNPYYVFSNSFLLQNFVFHNTQQWYMTSVNTENDTIYLQGDTNYSFNTPSMFTYSYPTYSISELQMDPAGSFLYLAYHNGNGFIQMQMFSLNPTDPQYVLNNSTGYTINLEIGTAGLPGSYTQIAVMYNKNAGYEEVIFTNPQIDPLKYTYLATYNPLSLYTSNTTLVHSEQSFDNVPTRIVGGAGGSKWALFNVAPYIFANRNDAYDAPTAINIAWQIFFPTMKIEMRQLTTGVTPITDLTNITYPEWPHTVMFAYSNYNSLINDISGIVGIQQCSWGQETNSNFMVSDVSFNGFQFNSYMMNVPLLPNYENGSYETDYYLAVRGWLPTEQFQTMMRFYLPNQYDFGFVRFLDISNEVQLAQTNSAEFSPQYLDTLLAFNSNFILSNVNFGSNAIQGLSGLNISSSNFGDFMNQYQAYYSTLSTNTYILSNIQSTIQASINQFIIYDLQYILPSTAVTRQRYTDALLFQIQWKSQLSPIYVTLDDEWGLGWNLGYAKQDTNFATVHTASSFYKITDDYIYLRLNPEFNINRMDAGGKENYKTSRESSGITNQYYCKLLLTSFGGNATTFIHNPITFTPPLYRLTKMEFQWIDTKGNIINNFDCEWDMVINVTEAINIVPNPSFKVKFPENLPFIPMIPAPDEENQPAYVETSNLPPTGIRKEDYPPALAIYDAQLMALKAQLPSNATTPMLYSNATTTTSNELNVIPANTYKNKFNPLKK